jgi:hypothetical protein
VRLQSKGKPPLELLEEAIHLLRNAPAGAVLSYLTGSAPLLLALLFFLSEMTRNPFAREQLAVESLGVAALFVWKRIWQAVFAAQLHGQLSGSGFAIRRLPLLIVVQCALQPLRLIALPVSLLMTIPFAWVVAFFRNVGLFAALGEPDPVRAARQQAGLWTRQNWGILSVVTLAALLLFLNLVVTIAVLPQLAKSFLGIEGEFARLGSNILNTTTLAVAASITWLAVDPLLEAVYVLRCFYGASVSSGEDLRAALRKATAIAAFVLVMVLMPVAASAQQVPAAAAAIDSARLDKSIDEVIRRREFTWRAAPPQSDEPQKEWPGWLQSAVRAIRNGVHWLGQKIEQWFKSNNREVVDGSRATERPPIELWSAAVALALVAGGVALFLRRRRSKPAQVTPVDNSATPVNLSDDSVTADQLPESSWLALADEWLTKGDYRLAMRALYLAGLNYLSQRDLVSIARYKTGLDYIRELERRARAGIGVSAEVVPVFQANNALFERGWYGRHAVDRAQVEAFASGLDEMRRFAPNK